MHPGISLYEVEVTNTRGVPIRLHDGTLWMDYGTPWDSQLGAILPVRTPYFSQLDIDATLHGSTPSAGSTGGLALKMPHGFRLYAAESITIPSHGVRSIRILVLEGTGLIPQDGQLRIRYTWISQPRHLTRRALHWLRQRLPDSLKPHLPTLKSEDTSTPVEYDKADLAPIHPAGQGRVATTSAR
jgi:hypothetical protein